MVSNESDFIIQAPRDVAGWARLFDAAHLPVLSGTAQALEELRPAEEQIDAHLLADALAADPLVTLKLLAHVAQLRRGRGGDIETVVEALVMLGIPPFFRAFAPQTSVQAVLAARPEALAGFDQVLRRSHRAARFALSFAAHRMDPDAAVIHEAALLHDFAELLLWCRAPDLALEIARRQADDPALRSSVAQRAVLNIELSELQHALMQSWRLPELLVQITDVHAQNPSVQVRNVRLAMRVARHSAKGWNNPALPDDLREIAQMLQMGTEPTMRLLLDVDGTE